MFKLMGAILSSRDDVCFTHLARKANKSKGHRDSGLCSSVEIGQRGFEPPTPASQMRCATRLRHCPPF